MSDELDIIDQLLDAQDEMLYESERGSYEKYIASQKHLEELKQAARKKIADLEASNASLKLMLGDAMRGGRQPTPGSAYDLTQRPCL